MSIVTSPSTTVDTPIPKMSRLSSIKQNNSTERSRMEITMMMGKDTYSSSTDTVSVIITNNTAIEWHTGMDYYVEYFNGTTWSKLPIEFCYNDIAIILSPQESKEFSIYLYPEQYSYKSGKYRICKTVTSADGKYELASQFNIQ